MKPNLTPAAIVKLRAAAHYAATHPAEFNMSMYIDAYVYDLLPDTGAEPPLPVPTSIIPSPIAALVPVLQDHRIYICNTTACLAGTLLLLNCPDLYVTEMLGSARLLNRLNPEALSAAKMKAEIDYLDLDVLGVACSMLEADQDLCLCIELETLFTDVNLIRQIDADNVVGAVEAFIQGGTQAVRTYLDGSTN